MNGPNLLSNLNLASLTSPLWFLLLPPKFLLPSAASTLWVLPSLSDRPGALMPNVALNTLLCCSSRGRDGNIVCESFFPTDRLNAIGNNDEHCDINLDPSDSFCLSMEGELDWFDLHGHGQVSFVDRNHSTKAAYLNSDSSSPRRWPAPTSSSPNCPTHASYPARPTSDLTDSTNHRAAPSSLRPPSRPRPSGRWELHSTRRKASGRRRRVCFLGA